MINIFRVGKSLKSVRNTPKYMFSADTEVSVKKEKTPVYLRPYDASKYEVPSTKLKVKKSNNL